MSKKIFRVLLISFGLLFIIYLILQSKFDNIDNNKIIKEEIVNYDSPDNMAFNIKLDFFDNCENNSCYNIDLEKFKDDIINDDNINISLKCLKEENILEDEINYCTLLNIRVDNKFDVTLNTVKNYYYDDAIVIFKTNDNYVVKEYNTLYGSGLLNIYDSTGSLLKEIEKSVSSFDIVNDEEIEDNTNRYEVSINENKLYYAYTEDMDYVLGLNNYVHIGYVLLDSNLEFNELYKVNAITSIGI